MIPRHVEFLYACAAILQCRPLYEAPLTELLARTRAMFRADVAELVLTDRGDGASSARLAVGPGDVRQVSVPADEGLAQDRMEHQAPDDGGADTDPQSVAVDARRDPAAPDPRDAIVASLPAPDRSIGTLSVARDAHAPPFDPGDRALLAALAVNVAVALQHAEPFHGSAATPPDRALLEATVRSSDDAILGLAPPGGIITAANPAAEHLFGCPADLLIGQSVITFIAPDRRDEARASFRGLAEGQPVRDVRSEIVRRDGTRVAVSATVSVITDVDGTPTGLSAIVRDETARGVAEAALRANEEQFRSVFRDGPIGMAMVASDLTWIAVNEALCRMLERSPADLLGSRVDEVVHPDDATTALRQEADLFTSPGEGGYTANRRYVTPRGTIAWARVTSRRLWQAEVPPWRSICVIEDITESRLAAERLRDTEARLHRAVAAFSAIREPENVLRAVLAAARDLLDARFAAIGVLDEDGSSIVDMQQEGMDEGHAAAIGHIAEGRGVLGLAGPESGPVRLTDVRTHPAFIGMPAGHPTVSSFLAVPIVSGGRLVARLYVGNKQGAAQFDEDDEGVATALAAQAAVVLENARIHARTLALVEELDRANAELKQANDAKSQFLGTVSHELRTPLHSILLAAELVQNPVVSSQSADRVRELGATIQGSGRHLLNLIDDLVDLSRIEAGRIELQPSEVSVAGLIGEVAREIEPLARAKSISVELPARGAGLVRGDPLRLRQVLLNLVANAVKFSRAGGRVSVDTSESNEMVLIRVSDTGIGIAQQDLERIFEPFEQVRPNGSSGAGLGLAIARRLVELHGGSLEVSSTLDIGTTFTVSLPRHAGSPASPAREGLAPAVELGIDLPRRPILLVEDDPVARRLMAELLVGLGFRVRQAAGVVPALEHLEAGTPSLILLDIRLGDGDGLDLARHARGTPVLRDVPIIALSADAMAHDVARALEAGCDDHLAKPVIPGELIARIQAALSGRDLANGRERPVGRRGRRSRASGRVARGATGRPGGSGRPERSQALGRS